MFGFFIVVKHLLCDIKDAIIKLSVVYKGVSIMKRNTHLNGLDCHHILYQKKHWKQGWASVLREHPYCRVYIPQNTLHREIHSKVHDIPTPCGKACRVAVEAINSWLESGLISLDDPLERRIEVISWCFRAKYKATTAMLDYQREVVIEFKKRH